MFFYMNIRLYYCFEIFEMVKMAFKHLLRQLGLLKEQAFKLPTRT